MVKISLHVRFHSAFLPCVFETRFLSLLAFIAPRKRIRLWFYSSAFSEAKVSLQSIKTRKNAAQNA
jgi:hypothetical protein